MTEHTKPDEQTRQADRDALDAPHSADTEPTADEERAAEQAEVSPDTPQHYQDMTDRGAEQEGEGKLP
ncbi:MAG: hypothetical protein M3394_05635 [Actinomycetota bacterium]|nr:hypothetical protein [Actinomycetota bacterium]